MRRLCFMYRLFRLYENPPLVAFIKAWRVRVCGMKQRIHP